MARDNVELLRSTYEAFGRGDIPAVMGTFAEDISWHAPAVLPQGGDAKGHEEVGEFFGRLAGSWDGFELELDDFVASGDRVCVIGRAQGRLDGTQTGYGFVHCWTVRDGVCTDFDEYVDPAPEMLAR
jgi:ketosteroid isomerase-like protein